MERTWKGQRNLRRKEIPEVFIDPPLGLLSCSNQDRVARAYRETEERKRVETRNSPAHVEGMDYFLTKVPR